MMRDPVSGIDFSRSASSIRVQGVAIPLNAVIDSAATD
jgi:hypothetical protein